MLIYLEIVAGVAAFGFLSAFVTGAIGNYRPKVRELTGTVTYSQQFKAWLLAMGFMAAFAIGIALIA